CARGGVYYYGSSYGWYFDVW
nr:immunoglobulin heavy chain junction region [Mus musculus]MBK4197854.1 immunoglobulin heavy chain junction region [Mus musculus]MBK4197855.1 immunoglobulin heavy chain junction region [Mus musculus]